MVFIDCAGQWRKDSAGTREAISRRELLASMQLLAVPPDKTDDTFARIRVLEAKAASIFLKRAKQARDKANRASRR